MIQNYDKVEHWRTQGRHGQNKLRNACRQRCLSVVARERKHRSGLKKGDTFFYSAQIIREVLPDIWDEDDWSSSGVSYSSDVTVAALLYEVAPRTIKRREARYLDKMVEKLGGESPFLR